jgi:lauroyl/myristoyl acyltransferase
MRFQNFTNSKAATQIGIFIGQHMPRRAGYGLVRFVSGIIARLKPEIYWTVRANLRQVLGPEVDDATLHEMTRRVFFHAGQTYYDFFSAIDQPPDEIAAEIRLPERVIELGKSDLAKGQSVLAVAPHMSNFDLAGVALRAFGMPAQILALPDPGAGFRMLNRLRANENLEITPITPESLRAAIRRLKRGGLVLTGIDRPIPGDKELIEFFGRPAYLPVGPVRLALMTGASVYLFSCHYEPDEGYVIEGAGPIEMIRTGDRRRDLLSNARRVAAILEGYVRAHPDQWMMFHPVWPEPTAD